MLEQLLDLASRAKSRLLAQYVNRPTLSALVGELGEAAQELETAVWGLIAQFNIDAAAGVWLDRLGVLVGEPRDGADDAAYRTYLRARIVANRSNGRIEDVIAVITAWNAGVAPAVELSVLPPANFELVVGPLIAMADLERLVRLLRATRAAGVGGMIITRPQVDADSFTFATTDAPEASSTQGFGDSTNPAVGGRFISAVRA